jgi:hypothetical protein
LLSERLRLYQPPTAAGKLVRRTGSVGTKTRERKAAQPSGPNAAGYVGYECPSLILQLVKEAVEKSRRDAMFIESPSPIDLEPINGRS